MQERSLKIPKKEKVRERGRKRDRKRGGREKQRKKHKVCLILENITHTHTITRESLTKLGG